MGVCIYTKRSFYMQKGINVSNIPRDRHEIWTKGFIHKALAFKFAQLTPKSIWLNMLVDGSLHYCILTIVLFCVFIFLSLILHDVKRAFYDLQAPFREYIYIS